MKKRRSTQTKPADMGGRVTRLVTRSQTQKLKTTAPAAAKSMAREGVKQPKPKVAEIKEPHPSVIQAQNFAKQHMGMGSEHVGLGRQAAPAWTKPAKDWSPPAAPAKTSRIATTRTHIRAHAKPYVAGTAIVLGGASAVHHRNSRREGQ